MFNLESRLDSVLMRLNIGTRFFIKQLILKRRILINNVIITRVNYQLNANDVLSFSKKIKILIYRRLISTVLRKNFLAQPPYYLMINYRTLCCIFLPKLMDSDCVPYPFFLRDNFIITGLHTTVWGW